MNRSRTSAPAPAAASTRILSSTVRRGPYACAMPSNGLRRSRELERPEVERVGGDRRATAGAHRVEQAPALERRHARRVDEVRGDGVARERGPVDDQHPVSLLGEQHRGRRARAPRTDHDHVVWGGHGATLRARGRPPSGVLPMPSARAASRTAPRRRASRRRSSRRRSARGGRRSSPRCRARGRSASSAARGRAGRRPRPRARSARPAARSAGAAARPRSRTAATASASSRPARASSPSAAAASAGGERRAMRPRLGHRVVGVGGGEHPRRRRTSAAAVVPGGSPSRPAARGGRWRPGRARPERRARSSTRSEW